MTARRPRSRTATACRATLGAVAVALLGGASALAQTGSDSLPGVDDAAYARFQQASKTVIDTFKADVPTMLGIDATASRFWSSVDTYRNQDYILYRRDAEKTIYRLVDKVDQWSTSEPASPETAVGKQCTASFRTCENGGAPLQCGITFVTCLGEGLAR
ncbi:MAG: hypothetical protein MI806_27205 [Minwuiales bacterium]|nr:hypothetical protein [Minwuiales bacterium]